MKRNDQNNPQANGYPQQNGFASDAYRGMPYQGYNTQGYQQSQGYSQQQGQQGYPQPGYSQYQYTQPQGYASSRNYQTPQVTGNQPPAGTPESSAAYTGQGSFYQNSYSQQGAGQPQTGYPGSSYAPQNGYQQPGPVGYGYQAPPAAGGSYIPQTPYSQGYTSPGYQAPSGYAQGYSAYNQMGRSQQIPYYPQRDDGGQVPLNGGGYVPQPIPVRKKPFVITDAYLLIFSAVLLALFALGMFVRGYSMLKWAFAVLAAGSIALLWIKPLVENNKRLCYTIVFGLLILVAVTGFVTGGPGTKQQDDTRTNQSQVSASGTQQNDPGAAGASNTEPAPTSAVTNTPAPADQDNAVTGRLQAFFSYWMANNQDAMLTLCSPTWQSKQENPKTAMFGLMRNRTPKEEIKLENISGTPNDTNRTVTMTVLMDLNNGKDPVRYRMSVIMVKENDGQWYVDPESLKSNEKSETPDPSITATPQPTETPSYTMNTVLYYNPNGGEYYHLDQNCKKINERYLPLQGHFTYAELEKDAYKKLKPCVICGAPSRGQLGN